MGRKNAAPAHACTAGVRRLAAVGTKGLQLLSSSQVAEQKRCARIARRGLYYLKRYVLFEAWHAAGGVKNAPQTHRNRG